MASKTRFAGRTSGPASSSAKIPPPPAAAIRGLLTVLLSLVACLVFVVRDFAAGLEVFELPPSGDCLQISVALGPFGLDVLKPASRPPPALILKVILGLVLGLGPTPTLLGVSPLLITEAAGPVLVPPVVFVGGLVPTPTLFNARFCSQNPSREPTDVSDSLASVSGLSLHLPPTFSPLFGTAVRSPS